MPQLVIGFVLAALVGLAGWRFGSLTRSGAFAAALVGGLVFGFGGPTWGAVLVAFFVSSSFLSHVKEETKRGIAEYDMRDHRRGIKQVLANGGVAAVLAIAVGIVTHESNWYPYLTLAYFGSLSAATADTWATEIGVLSSRPARLITTGAVVPAGISGGVTLLGVSASLAGGVFLGLTAFTLIQLASFFTTGNLFLQDWFLIPLCATAGIAGSLIDSLLGATLQRSYYCPNCQTYTERADHRCGKVADPVRGLSWLGNNAVNLVATITGALTAVLISPLFL